MRLGYLLLEEGILNRRQRDFSGGKTVPGRGRNSANRDLRELGDGLVAKDKFRRKFKTCLICACDDLDRENRVASELKEAVVNAELLETKHLLPYLRQRLFDC